MRRLNILPPDLDRRMPPAGPCDEQVLQPGLPLASLTLRLESITPIVGGGSMPHEPDPLEQVRVPAIRGQLRSWWRSVGIEGDAELLFQAETLLWGGVGLEKGKRNAARGTGDDADGARGHPKPKKHDARVSRIRLRIEQVEQSGRDVAAGWHRRNGDRLRVIPDWRIGRQDDIGYGLFPLQRNNDERKEAERDRGDLPTTCVREQVRFALRLEVVPQKEDFDEKGSLIWALQKELNRLMAALWAWIHFGGLGARTTRGFGQLSLLELRVDPVRTCREAREIVTEWKKRFVLPGRAEPKALLEHFRDFSKAATLRPVSLEQPWPGLHGAVLLFGPPRDSALEALRVVLGNLRQFRQGEGIGRAPRNQEGRPGRSYWPEADAMKLAREKSERQGKEGKTSPGWNAALLRSGSAGHPMRKDAALVAPRAAFGMPLLIHFKDGFDKEADGQISPIGQDEKRLERYRSPVRLGVLACQDKRFVPIVLVLSMPLPEVGVFLDKADKLDKAARSVSLFPHQGQGAVDPIQGRLRTTQGDAVKAWCRWLEQQQSFQTLNLFPSREGSR